MGSREAKWESDQLHRWGGGGRLNVLANRQTPLWLVSRTGLRLQLCEGPPAIHRHKCRSADWYSVIVLQPRTRYSDLFIASINSSTVDTGGKQPFPLHTTAKLPSLFSPGRCGSVTASAGGNAPNSSLPNRMPLLFTAYRASATASSRRAAASSPITQTCTARCTIRCNASP